MAETIHELLLRVIEDEAQRQDAGFALGAILSIHRDESDESLVEYLEGWIRTYAWQKVRLAEIREAVANTPAELLVFAAPKPKERRIDSRQKIHEQQFKIQLAAGKLGEIEYPTSPCEVHWIEPDRDKFQVEFGITYGLYQVYFDDGYPVPPCRRSDNGRLIVLPNSEPEMKAWIEAQAGDQK